MDSRWCVLLNPNAGRGQVRRHFPALFRALRNTGLSFELAVTRARYEATTFTRQALERGCTHLVVVGGDGTLYEVVNGMLAHQGHTPTPHQRAALGIIALGTGNDFVKSLDTLTLDTLDTHNTDTTAGLSGIVRRLAAGRTREIDAGWLSVSRTDGTTTTTCFLNDLGVGIHALVAAEAQKPMRLKGKAVYALAVIRALTTYRALPLTIHTGDTDTQQDNRTIFLGCVANGRCHGSGFWLTPDALLDDGHFDVCLIDDVPLVDVVRFMPRVWKGTHTGLPPVTMRRASRVVIESPVPLLISADGEIVCTDGVRVEAQVLPRALTLLV